MSSPFAKLNFETIIKCTAMSKTSHCCPNARNRKPSYVGFVFETFFDVNISMS